MEYHPRYRSEQINDIAAALAASQCCYTALRPNELGSYGKYANLDAIKAAVTPALSKNGISFHQYTQIDDDIMWLKTSLMHSSGQYIASCERITKVQPLRKYGKDLEFYKRQQALLLLGIAPSKNDPDSLDDDGEEDERLHTIAELKKPTNLLESEPVPLQKDRTINKHEYQELLIELKNYPEIGKQIMNTYQIDSIADLPASKYVHARNQIMQLREAYKDEIRAKR